ncbi:nicotinamide-nucleotide amidase [Caminicella sporogenes DSM 14501]|uniref:Putative competence-damage inducible protein n=1 Tax=Caminicella sporogenes DSM 14501 TaxID=1121266 RepID=A0A1M6L6N1_9FIRM|nr:competence/damage-inducible protein A [Caminicella sporogenes]RKD27725.1 competence/damage-inducible protein A [Caminicella sporogenes]WIF94697.1 competence/damage-inducible protein A [Caminicella sporogenes]SHJ66881.1 nicotinamide-nucleotide amidase [Caminicella sporogenes DSM 14501]
MNCSILSVGTELLMGQTINSNTFFLSRKLNELGYNVLYHFSVGDNPDRLENIFKTALDISDIVITTGGLGPTQDDLTKEIISRFIGKELKLNEDSLKKIKYYFEKINREMTDNNIKQAFIPEGAIVLPNDIGTAPGFILNENEKIIICLPGPPREMNLMFQNYVKPYLAEKSKYIIKSDIIKFFGIGESKLEWILQDLISNQTNPTLATYANEGELSLRITARGKSLEEAEKLINPIKQEIKKRLDKFIYSYNNQSLEEVVGDMLIRKNVSISLAESCTGGLLVSKLTSIPGISSVLDRAIVTYSNRAKIDELGVKRETLEKYGAVSKETAMEMAEGLKDITGSKICLSITGIAGPTGATSKKPVGLVYIGVSTDEKTFYYKYNFNGSRNKIRNYSAMTALNIIRKIIEKY